MTDQHPRHLDTGTPAAPVDDSAAPAGVDASVVTGLAREIETARRELNRLHALVGRVDDLAVVVAGLADTVTPSNTAERVEPVPSWLDLAPDPGRDPAASPVVRDAEELLATLAGWVGGVYLRYHDAVTGFPECWLWHPEVVEELLWLHSAWLAAYVDGSAPSVVGDWHDRQRPGVVTRISGYVGHCSLEAHLPSQERHTAAPIAPTGDAVEAIASWWATARAQPGPVPSADQLAAAAAARRRASRTRR